MVPDLFQLLGEDRFQDIEKIKTIGSTYMAVSGLSPEKQVKEYPALSCTLWQEPHSCCVTEERGAIITRLCLGTGREEI